MSAPTGTPADRSALDGVPERQWYDAARQRIRRLSVVVSLVAALAAWVLAASTLPAGLPVGIVGLGAVTGALTSFTALGLVLIYRSSRIVNFAQAEVGGVAASMAVLLATNRNVNYFLAAGLSLLAAFAIGAIVERTVVRRFFEAPRLILTVATIGLAQILGALILFLPELIPPVDGPGTYVAEPFTTPFDVRHEIYPVTFNGNHLLAVVAVVGVVAGLTYLFNRTDIGVGIRGAADSQERALLLGIPVKRLSLITWSVAAGLSGLAGMLTAGVLGSTAGSAAGPTALLAPLAAAVIARFESLPLAFSASVGIGIFSEAAYWNFPQATTVDVALFLVLLVSLLLQRERSTRVTGEELGGFVAAREATTLPAAIRALNGFRVARVAIICVGGTTALLLPAISTDARVVLYSFIAIYAIIGVSLVILTGWAGQVSLGQFAFVGLGAAVAGSLSVNAGLDYLLCVVAACVVGALVAVLIGLPALRIPGLFLAPVTLAFAVAASSWILNPQYFDWLTPRRVDPPVLFGRFDLGEADALYYTCLAALGVSILVARNTRRTRVGRAIIAARDNSRFASAVSIEPVRIKLVAFALSGALAGMAGALYVLAVRGVPFGSFSPDLSVQLFTMVVVGGLTSVLGGVLGALYVYVAQYTLSGAAQLLATGAGLLAVLLVAPGGLSEVFFRTRDRYVRMLCKRRGLDIPGWSDGQEQALESESARAGPGDPSQAENLPEGLLCCDGIGAGYGHLQVLFGLDLRLPESSIVAILGTNGAGKTTTLRTIAGTLPASHGTITFDGEDITDLGPVERVHRGIVMVPAKGVFPSLTVRENLRLASWVPNRRGDAGFVRETTSQVFDLFPVLEERLEQRASLLSGGEQQMLAIAQGLLANPRMLLIDELSLGLAPIVVNAIAQVVEQLNAGGLPIVVVEQSINVSATIALHAILIEKGEVRYAGPTSALEGQQALQSVLLGGGSVDGATPDVNGRRQRRSGTPGSSGVAPVIFSANGVSKSYGAVNAVADLALDVRRGQIVGVIGSNGAGKTTAFDIFSGFTAPDSGTLTFNGMDITQSSAAERSSLGFGRTFQDVRLLPSLTVSEALAVSMERHVDVREPLACALHLSATSASERRVDARVDALLDAFDLGPHRTALVSDLSTGTRRIVELACVAGHAPTFLLLDEPSSGLSQDETGEMAQVLLELARATGATLMIIEHDVSLVSSLSDELVCMDLGRVIARGRPESVLSDDRVLRSYLGESDGETPDPDSRRKVPLRAN